MTSRIMFFALFFFFLSSNFGLAQNEKIVASGSGPLIPLTKVALLETYFKGDHILVVKTRYGNFETYIENVKVVYDYSVGGTHVEIKPYTNPPRLFNDITNAWVCERMTIIVRTDDLVVSWMGVLRDRIKKAGILKDIGPPVEK